METPMPLTINGTEYVFAGDPRVTLLDFLRRDCGLTGSKKGCDHGQCGACTVLVNGQRINSCLTLAISHNGAATPPTEGRGPPEHMHPLQDAFVLSTAINAGIARPGRSV